MALGGIALVQTLEIIVEPGVGKFDELGQRCAGEIAVFVVDRLDPRAVHRDQLPAEQVHWRPSSAYSEAKRPVIPIHSGH